MPTGDFQSATQELFDTEQVEVLEWSFDMPFKGVIVNSWCTELLDRYSENQSLFGHGVNLSLLSARFSERQERWLASTREEFGRRKYIHASEHFGFFEAGPVEIGAPLAVPLTTASLAQGKEMIKRYADATQCTVGLENLAFAFSQEDVRRQGEFIDRLISEVDGFLLLDLHNIYCQLENFGVPALDLLNSYPLAKVREIHLSGGSWSHSESGKRLAVRRDTHDDAVPQDVFNLFALALELCPNLEVVILERLGGTMNDGEAQQIFREDFETIKDVLDLVYD